eukprot:COSAG01_NODE_817_length_13376_cov_2.970101_11_plen_122_part_00
MATGDALADLESQPPSPPGAPQLSAELAAQSGTALAWRMPAPLPTDGGDSNRAAAPEALITGWELQMGFPLLGGWDDVPCTSEAWVSALPPCACSKPLLSPTLHARSWPLRQRSSVGSTRT